MFKFDINDDKIKNIHMIGIGGVSMSGIAQLLDYNGFTVTGSDRSDSQRIEKMKDKGIDIKIGQAKENIKNPDLVIYTDAIADDNEELIAAREVGCPVVTRGVFLGALMRNYDHSIAVSGSHGKSTTTSIISKILINSPINPTILLGGSLDEIDGNVMLGDDSYMVTEACEFKGNIKYYYPQTVIILNIDDDHLDYYKNIENIIETFKLYMTHIQKGGMAIINIDDKNCREILSSVEEKCITFGIENKEADYNIINLEFDKMNRPSFDIVFPDKNVHHFELGLIGRFNCYNAAAAIIACYENKVDVKTIQKSVKEFKNLHRRMEEIGEKNGTIIMTDYGHHPNEIKSTLKALKEGRKERLICVFQPHTFSRTKLLLDEFADAFYDCDQVVVTDIYAAREPFDPTIHSEDLVKKLRENGVNANYKGTFDEAKDYLYEIMEPNEIIITTGCGNPDVLAHMLAEDKKEKEIFL